MPLFADDHYAFRHPVTRDGAYQLMPPSARVRLHAAAASVIESSASGEPGPADVEAAEHLRAAIAGSGGYLHAPRDWAEAEVRAATRAARWLADNFRLAAAIALWERVAANPAAATRDRLDALRAAAAAFESMGNPLGAERLALALLDAAGENPAHAIDRAHGLRLAGSAAEQAGRPRVAGERLVRAVTEARATGDRALLAACLSTIANHHRHTGRLAEAEAGHREAMAIAQEIGDRALEARALGNLGNVLRDTGRGPLADDAHIHVLAMARTLGNRALLTAAIANRAIISSNQGLTGEAAAGYREAIALARETGNRRSLANSLGNLASVMRDIGNDAESESLRRQALQIAREVSDRRAEASNLGHIADILREAGRPKEAFTDIVAALEIHRETEYLRGAGQDLIVFGQIVRDLRAAGVEPSFPPNWHWPRETAASFRLALALFERVRDFAHQAVAVRELADWLAAADPANPEIAQLREREAALSFAGEPHG